MNICTKSIRIILLMSLLVVTMGSVCRKMRYPTREMRGLWVTRWEWAIGDSNKEEVQKRRIRDIFDQALNVKANVIFFQIRGNGDAFYVSKYEPWSELLSHKLGVDPGWDPLEFAINEAHKRGLELHVWFNTFPAWRGKTPPIHTRPEHVYNAHPEWLVCDKSGEPVKLSNHYVSLSPGIPAVRKYINDVAMDIVSKYDIDGFHFDYIRYPEHADKLGYSHDSISVRLFKSRAGNPYNLDWDDWQRENINQFVRMFYDNATNLKPWVKVSAAVIGKYDYSAWNGYHVVYQDAMRWIKESKIDFIVPMIYWQTDHKTAPFEKITKDWLQNNVYERYIFPGLMINNLGSEKWPGEEVVKQIQICRKYGNGMVFFSHGGLTRAIEAIQEKGDILPANVPAMSWKDDKPPMDPRNLRAEFLADGTIKLMWDDSNSYNGPEDVVRFNVYRGEDRFIDYDDARDLLHITSNLDNEYFDTTAKFGTQYFYAVTALDRVGNESPPSNILEINIPLIAASENDRNTYLD